MSKKAITLTAAAVLSAGGAFGFGMVTAVQTADMPPVERHAVRLNHAVAAAPLGGFVLAGEYFADAAAKSPLSATMFADPSIPSMPFDMPSAVVMAPAPDLPVLITAEQLERRFDQINAGMGVEREVADNDADYSGGGDLYRTAEEMYGSGVKGGPGHLTVAQMYGGQGPVPVASTTPTWVWSVETITGWGPVLVLTPDRVASKR